MSVRTDQRGERSGAARPRYRLPVPAKSIDLEPLILRTGRTIQEKLPSEEVYYAGNIELLRNKAVSIVGTREVSEEGARRAARLARELTAAGVVVVSGLAKGVDTAALSSTLDVGGHAAAVIGTPLQKAYPVENARLQMEIAEQHLLLSPFAEGEAVFRGNFPKRNKVMALLSDATVIVEASDTSGTLHQAAECIKQGRWLFILKSVLDDDKLQWPKRFIKAERTVVLTGTDDILSRI
ncbi:DNA-processing protein DprA [Methylobacterium fujisawaense]|uniref:DNA-processing protein DprA n=1 Tax=Methylobacterium fujisawaense TaxID=107400 RepID=UPI00313B864E